MTQPNALESAVIPTPTNLTSRPPCVLLVPGAIPATTDETPPATPLAEANHREVEDESADPVGDGCSDAELARRMDDGTAVSTEPVPTVDEHTTVKTTGKSTDESTNETTEKAAGTTDVERGRFPAP